MNRDPETPAGAGPADTESAEATSRREARWSFRRAEKEKKRGDGPADTGPPGDDPSITAVHAPVRPDGARAPEASAQDPGSHDPLAARGTDRGIGDTGDTGSAGGTGRGSGPEKGSVASTAKSTATDTDRSTTTAAHARTTATGGSTGGADEVRTRWREVQGSFVDDPAAAVHEADALIAAELEELSARLAARRGGIRSRWQDGAGTDTEALRTTLREYRSFLDRVLTLKDD